MEQIEINRSAIVAVYKKQNLQALSDVVSRGDLTSAQAARVHLLFMQSDILQTLVTRDAMAVEAMLQGEVH